MFPLMYTQALVGGMRTILRMGEAIPPPDPNAPQKGMLLSVPLFHVVSIFRN